MMHNHDRVPHRGEDRTDPGDARAQSLLEHAYASAPPPDLQAAMDRAVFARMEAAAQREVPRRAFPPRVRYRPAIIGAASLAAALALALSGVPGYMRMPRPPPRRAQNTQT